MAMSKRIFRTKQAIEAFQKCAECDTLPANKKAEVASELAKAKARFAQQEAEVSLLVLDCDVLFIVVSVSPC